MKYFKNTELAKIYNISEKSVRNWIEAAKNGKLELELYTEGDRHFIANTAKNTFAVEQMVQKGKKYKNTRGFKTVTPSSKFYEQYSPKQVFDIVSNIEIHREIPHLYSYFNGGAKHWDLYSKKLLNEESPNMLTKTIELLELNTDYIDSLIEGHESINVIDLGVGNSLPVKKFLKHLLKKGVLNRYIGIDTSKDMLDIAKNNIKSWFGDQVQFEGYVRNIVYDRFEDLLINDSFGTSTSSSTVNLVLFLGGTILNFREPDHALETVNSSMGKDDILLYSLKLDTERARRYFDFTAGASGPTLDLKEKAILDLLNIEESFYEVDQHFNEEKMARQIQVRLKVGIAIDFQLEGQQRVVELNKGESIFLWRARHQSAIDTINQFDKSGFELIQATRSKDQEYLLLICKIKTTV